VNFQPSSTASRPLDYSRPCWTCHWFGSEGDGAGDGICMDPRGHRAGATFKARGCAFWMRETGVDDVPSPEWVKQAPSLVRHAIRDLHNLARDRLEIIHEWTRRIEMAPLVYSRVRGRSGYIEPTLTPVSTRESIAATKVKIDKSGVNGAILAGRRIFPPRR